jgi:hypothetical protein
VKKNHKTIREHFKDLGIEEFIEVEDSLDAYTECWAKLYKYAKAAHDSKGTIKAMVYIYNAGHGVMFGGSVLT